LASASLINCQAPKVNATVKAPAPKASVGVKVGGTVGAAGAVKAAVPKATAGAKASTGGKAKLKVAVKVPKVSGKLSIKGGLGLKATTKAKASSSKSDEKPIEGSCPKASLFKMTSVKPEKYSVKTICKDLEATCCKPEDMQNVQKKLEELVISRR